jgi:hypothetical protein
MQPKLSRGSRALGSKPLARLLAHSGPDHGRRFEPIAPVFELGNCKRGVVGPLHRPPAFQEQIQPREMETNRSSRRRHIHAGVLCGIRIYREAVKPRESIVAEPSR